MRSFGPLVCFNIVSASIAYILHWTMSSLVVDLTLYFDFLFLGLNAVIMMVWSIGMPFMLRRAMKESKRKVIHTYSGHIESAFKNFLENPDENNLERFNWLKKHQKLISQISSWPLSLGETMIAIVGGNLIMIIVNIWYCLKRTGYLTVFIEMISG